MLKDMISFFFKLFGLREVFYLPVGFIFRNSAFLGWQLRN